MNLQAPDARRQTPAPIYRGRLAPSPTGYLHLGHARTFWVAQQRAKQNGGELILRNDDLDSTRYQMKFVDAMLEDMRWFGFDWSEGPDIGGNFAPYNQSERMSFYQAALDKLRAGNFIYPCTCSRKDIQQAVTAPHAADDEVVYPGTCRPENGSGVSAERRKLAQKIDGGFLPKAATPSWRFRVPDGETISFHDKNLGEQKFIAGKDFGDFVVWRGDGVPAYQLSCAVDDAAMQITEVVRGADLLVSTARQILLYRALGLTPPNFFHCELMLDDSGQRLAKRHDALSLRTLRGQGKTPKELRKSFS